MSIPSSEKPAAVQIRVHFPSYKGEIVSRLSSTAGLRPDSYTLYQLTSWHSAAPSKARYIE